jgi:hypothetical protein
MINAYLELYRLYQVYPQECKGLLYTMMFHQFMFLWVNIWIYGALVTPYLLLLFLDVIWQSFLNIYLVNEMHYVWMKSYIEEMNQ